MIIAAVNITVEDYDQWKKVYDNMEGARRDAGARFARVNQLVDDPNTVTVVLGFDSADAANAYLTSPALRDAQQNAGMTGGPPRIEIYEETEAKQY